jgi:hypothetical protein
MTNIVARISACFRSGSAHNIASVRPSSKEIITALFGSGFPPENADATSVAVTSCIPAARSVARCCPNRVGDVTKPPRLSSDADPNPWYTSTATAFR